MSRKTTYHIDVTPEEDRLFKDKSTKEPTIKSKIMNTKIIATVIALHVLGIAGIYAISPKPNSTMTDTPPQVQAVPSATPTPTPAPTPAPTPSDTPTRSAPPKLATIKHTPPTIVAAASVHPKTNLQHKASKLIATHYTVKPGDTIFSIAKKYKVGVKALADINNIKDTSKIRSGQTLKLVK